MTEAYEPSVLAESSPEQQAAWAINKTTHEALDHNGSISPEQLQTRIEIAATLVSDEAQPLVQQYLSTLQEFYNGATIEKLPKGIGGQFDGEVAIAAQAVEVDQQGVGTTIARMEEINEHEAYHADHNHLQSLEFVVTENGGSEVIIGQRSFDQEALIEGLTVAETGDTFVSDDYRAKMQNLLGAIDAAPGLTLDGVRRAVNETKNMYEIDDRTRADVAMPHYAMAA